MIAIIGQLLPLAVGIAISPLPIIAGILMLLSPRARSTSVGYLVGWLGGIVVVTTVFALMSSIVPAGQDASRWWLSAVQLALGVLLLLIAVRQWRGRPRAGADAVMPDWMKRIDGMGFGSAFGLGFLLAAVNPKNLLLGASAGVTVGGAASGVGGSALSILIFTVIAEITIIIPVVGLLVAPRALQKPLENLRAWLLAENAVIMSVLLLVMGAVVIGKAITGLAS